MAATFPYLWTSLAMLALALLCYWQHRAQRRVLALCAIAGALYGVMSFEFIPYYWDPKVTFHFVTSPEDLIFSSATGILAWSAAVWPFQDRLAYQINLRRIVPRFLMFGLPGVAIAYSVALSTMPHRPMVTTMIGVGVMTIVFLYLKRGMWPLMLSGGLGFGLFYTVLLKLSYIVFPHFKEQWTPALQLPFEILGMPAWEIIWAVAYGAVFPLFITVVLEARLAKRHGAAIPAAQQRPPI